MMKRGEVWLARLDTAVGFEIKKTRPVVIIQNDIGNKNAGTTIIAPLTSKNLHNLFPVESFCKVNEKPGKILCDQIRTLDKSRFIKKMDQLSVFEVNLLNDAIKNSLDLKN